MVEPPIQFWVRGILKIDDGIHVAVEKRVLKQLIGRMRHPGVREFRVRMDFVADESAEVGCRGRAVEAVIVVENSNQHEVPALGKLDSMPDPLGVAQAR